VITVRSFSKPEEAHLFRTRLEAAGIPAYVQDEHMVQMDWFASNAIGGVRVQIAEEDREAAEEFLAADTPQDLSAVEDVVCPSCGSNATALDDVPRRLSFLSIMVFHFPLPIGRSKWRCSACNHVFRPATPSQES
jgi:rubredoxin